MRLSSFLRLSLLFGHLHFWRPLINYFNSCLHFYFFHFHKKDGKCSLVSIFHTILSIFHIIMPINCFIKFLSPPGSFSARPTMTTIIYCTSYILYLSYIIWIISYIVYLKSYIHYCISYFMNCISYIIYYISYIMYDISYIIHHILYIIRFIASARVYKLCALICSRIFMKFKTFVHKIVIDQLIKFHNNLSFCSGDICKTILTFRKH